MSAPRMRLAWITPSYQLDAHDVWSPGLTALAHRLAEQHELVVYSLRNRGGRKRFRIGQIEVHAFAPGPPAGVRGIERLGPLLRALSTLLRQPEDSRPDLVHALWVTEPALVGAMASHLLRRPLVVSSMGGEPTSMPAIGFGGARTTSGRLLFEAGVKAAHTVTAGSGWHANVLRARIGRAKPLVVLPLGIDLSQFGGAAPHVPRTVGTPLRMLAVGSLLPVKGHRVLIEALPILLHRLPAELRSFRLRIIGEGSERPALEALIDRLGLGSWVELVGELAYSAMPSQYAASDLLIHPSHYESECLVLIEALASGLPVVATAVGLAPELLGDARAGELAARPEPLAVASAVERLLARREQWPELERNAREVALPFAVERTTEKWLELYRQIARGASGTSGLTVFSAPTHPSG